MSPEILSRIMKFSVGPFDPTISDVHNPVHATIAVNHASKDYSYIDIDNKNNNNDIIIPDSKVTRPKLKDDHKKTFMEHFQVNELVKLNNEIDELYAKLTADPTIFNANDIDTAVNSL